MRHLAEVTTLRDRRVAACDKFAGKCLGLSRFSKWHPLRPERRGRTQGGETYLEVGERNKEYREGNRVNEQMVPARGSRKQDRR